MELSLIILHVRYYNFRNSISELFVNWTNQKIKDTFVERNAFNFKYIKAFQIELADRPGPMVCFATPGMLHAGQSLEIFKAWYEMLIK